MSLTFGLENAPHLFEKLKRDAKLLEDEITSDRFFNFVVTGYSLINWIENDIAQPVSVRKAVSEMHKDQWIKICGDLANASKHFCLTQRTPITKNAETVEYGWGHRWGEAWGRGGQGIRIELNDGISFSDLEFVTNVVNVWEEFFRLHNL